MRPVNECDEKMYQSDGQNPQIRRRRAEEGLDHERRQPAARRSLMIAVASLNNLLVHNGLLLIDDINAAV